MIRVENLTRTYPAPEGGEIAALAGVSLRVDARELVAVVGPSGSGKSTLLHAMGGLAAPTSGHVFLGETRVYDLDPKARAALRLTEIGYVFQTFNLVPYLTCVENVALPAMLAGRPRAEAREAALGVLERLGLSARRNHRPAQLSVGERQRVGIGRAIVNGPRVLLADEPTGNLDRGTGAHVMDLLFGLRERFGTTLLLITHDPLLAERCERQVRIEDGRIVADGPR